MTVWPTVLTFWGVSSLIMGPTIPTLPSVEVLAVSDKTIVWHTVPIVEVLAHAVAISSQYQLVPMIQWRVGEIVPGTWHLHHWWRHALRMSCMVVSHNVINGDAMLRMSPDVMSHSFITCDITLRVTPNVVSHTQHSVIIVNSNLRMSPVVVSRSFIAADARWECLRMCFFHHWWCCLH